MSMEAFVIIQLGHLILFTLGRSLRTQNLKQCLQKHQDYHQYHTTSINEVSTEFELFCLNTSFLVQLPECMPDKLEEMKPLK